MPLDVIASRQTTTAELHYLKRTTEKPARYVMEPPAGVPRWNGVDDPMALADEAIDRLGKRAVEEAAGQKVLKPTAFALGIARMLLQEESRRKQRTVDATRHWEMHRPESMPETEALDEALQNCLAKLHPDRRRLLERYYLHAGREKARSHQKLADEMGVAINALRNRALRARQELEACIRKRVGGNNP